MSECNGGEITVFDYGMGNLKSVFNAFRFLGFDVVVTSDPARIASAGRLVFPGVGAFGECAKFLKRNGAASAIADFINSGRPYLGICIGLQILFERSAESPGEEGLGVFEGDVLKFSPDSRLKVPHMGWNRVVQKAESRIFEGVEDGSWFYFVHSFYAEPQDDSVVAARSGYGVDFAAALEKNNIFACQFHPERSSDTGLKILRNFAEFQPSVRP